MKTHSDSNDPGNTPDQNTDGDRDLVCLALRVTDEESANVLLDTLASDNATATFLFSEEQLSSLGDLLRRVVISGNAAALRIDASGGSPRTLSAIERANNALWAACNEKARLVALYGASDKTLRAVRAAGYCPIDFDLDYSGGLPTAAQAASSIARQARSGGCIAYLGADTAVPGRLEHAALSPPLVLAPHHGAQRARGHKGRVTVLQIVQEKRTISRIINNNTEERHTLV